jgi:hypothetical protein
MQTIWLSLRDETMASSRPNSTLNVSKSVLGFKPENLGTGGKHATNSAMLLVKMVSYISRALEQFFCHFEQGSHLYASIYLLVHGKNPVSHTSEEC